MGFRFRRSIKLLPGVRLNVSTRGASVSVGGRGATVNFSSRGARATFGIPGTGLSWSSPLSSPPPRHSTRVSRGPSRQQIEAANRRLIEGARREQAQADVDRFEAALRDLVDCWRDIPSIPSSEGYRAALVMQPLTFGEAPPSAPDLVRAKEELRRQVEAVAETDAQRSFQSRALPWVGATAIAGAGLTVGFLLDVWAAGVGGVVVGATVAIAGSTFATRVWRNTVARMANERLANLWSENKQKLEAVHAVALRDFELRRASAREQWEAQELDRIAFVRRLLDGDLDAIEESVSASLGDLDVPFETQAEVAAADAQTLYLHLDLPEIEDVIPEHGHTALKDGSLKEVKRKKTERCGVYASLVTGLAFMMAAAAFATAPTVTTVSIAAYTQRKQRRTAKIGDDYVYEVTVPRRELITVDFSAADPVSLISHLGGRLEQSAHLELKKLKPPAWALEFAGP